MPNNPRAERFLFRVGGFAIVVGVLILLYVLAWTIKDAL